MVQKEKKYITWEGLNQHAKNTGKKIKEYDAGVIGGYNGSFPLTAATKGNIYLLPATKKYYVCIENYNGSQLTAPNANFEELSVYTNRSKLDNLITIEKITGGAITKFSNGLMIYSFEKLFSEKEKYIFKIPFINTDYAVTITWNRDNSYYDTPLIVTVADKTTSSFNVNLTNEKTGTCGVIIIGRWK